MVEQDTSHLQGPSGAIGATWAGRGDRGTETRLSSPPRQPVGLGTPLLTGLSPCPWHASEAKGCRESSWGTLRRRVALVGMLPLPLPAQGSRAGEAPVPPACRGGQATASGQRCGREQQGSPSIPAGRRWQRCPSARGPQSGTRHCQQAACCLLDSEIWPQLARIQFNYDKQRLHPLSRD